MSPESERKPMIALNKESITKVQLGELLSFTGLLTEL